MTYVDSFILPVPTANKDEYIAFAKTVAEGFKKYGALKVMECWGDDIPDGEVTSYPLALKLQEDESVVVAINIWPSKEVRDNAMEKAMTDPVFAGEPSMPFDGQRMIMGGFETILDE